MHSMDNSTSIPAFLSKLWKLVNDPETNHLIYWSKNGRSFVIKNHILFSQELLPKYYKHSNLASFIRQLNMYGFHKVMSVDSGTLRNEHDEMEFAHSFFIKGKEEELEKIRRKGTMFSRSLGHFDSKGVNQLVEEVQNVKKSQDSMESKLINLKRENELIWREYASMRQQFSKQQKIIQKLVQFLVAFTKMPSNHITPKRKFTHLALEGGEDATIASTSNSLERGLPTSSIEVEPGKTLSPSGPVIQEIIGFEDSNPSDLHQVFSNLPPTNKGGSSNINKGIVKDRRVFLSPQKGMKGKNEDLSQKYVLVNKGNYGISDDSNSPVDFNQLFADDGSRVMYHPTDVSSTDVQTTSETLNFPMIESPNGTILETVSPEEFLNPISPAEVMPSTTRTVIAPVKSHPNTSSSIVPSKGKKIYNTAISSQNSTNSSTLVPYNPSNPGLTASAPTQPPVFKVHSQPKAFKKTPPQRQVLVNMPGGKVMNVKLATIPSSSGGKAPSPSNAESAVSKVNNDVAIANIATSEELQTHVDEIQSSINFLQDCLTSGNSLNLDSSLLSLFDFDNAGPSELTVPNNGEITGNELSVYNPPLDLQAEAASLPVQPSKPISVKRENQTEFEDFLGHSAAPLSIFEEEEDEVGLDQESPKKKLRIKKESNHETDPNPWNEDKGLETPQIMMSPYYHNSFFTDDGAT